MDRTPRPPRPFLSLLLALAMFAAVPVLRAGAQTEPAPGLDPSTTTTTPAAPASTSTTRPPTSSTTTTTTPDVRPDAPSTTEPYLPPIPPELSEDPRVPFLVDPGPDDGIDIPIAQASFDPRSVLVMPELVAAAELALDEARTVLVDLQQRIAEVGATSARLRSELSALRADARRAVARAADARRALADHAVTAYVLGDLEAHVALIPRERVEDHSVAKHYVKAVVGTRERLLRDYERASRGLSREESELARRLGDVDSLVVALSAQVGPAFEDVVERTRALEAYRAGAQAYIDGFVFPVAGPSEFIDSWGYPRMRGTEYAHWHQGTDIFAAHGTPLIASENGVLARIGVGTLGGNKLWVRGDSGNEYYYAHLSAFAPGIADGQRVRAGDVVGFVGDTGNARGTSPHLHFEIHPGGRGPVNPYPLLRAAYGNRPTFRAVPPATTVPPLSGLAPPEPAAPEPPGG